MSRDWTKKELKAVSKAMKEEGYMSFGEFCKIRRESLFIQKELKTQRTQQIQQIQRQRLPQ